MNKEHYNQLIIKQLSEGLSPTQSAELEEWLQDHPDNPKIKARLEMAWKHADLYKSDIEIDQIRDWKKVSNGLAVNTKVISIWKQKWVAVAASVLILVSLGWFFFQKSTPTIIQYATTEKEIRTISLPDGSIVTMNENSELSYREENNKRLVDLTGEAFFEVSPDPNKAFTVFQLGTKTTVLGTKFNVDASALPEVKVSLLEGKVSFEADGHDMVVLAPGEEVSYNHDSDNLIQDQEVDENLLYWKDKKLNFNNESITEVIKAIEEYFDKDIELILDKEACRFTGSFDDPKYESLIEVLQFTYDMDFVKGNTKDQIQIHNCK